MIRKYTYTYNKKSKTHNNKHRTMLKHSKTNKTLKLKHKQRKYKNANTNTNKYRNTNYKKNYHRGGFSSCNLATIKEPSFNVPSMGGIDGLTIAEAKGAIFRPNCNTDVYQAMTP